MKTTYINANILNGTKDMVLQEGMMLTVDNGKITKIQKYQGEEVLGNVVDLNGKYIIPGLINLHVHTPGNGFPKKKQSDSKKVAKLVMSTKLTQNIGKILVKDAIKTAVLSGTTTIRTVGGLGHFDSEMRDKVKAGKVVGPRIISCDMAVTIPNGHMEGSVAYGATSDEDFVKFVEDNCKAGVDWIKIMVTGGVLDAKVVGEPGDMKMDAHQVKICCDTAHRLGKKVCAHVESPKGVEVALENGVDSIEHGSSMSDECIKMFKKNNSVLVCTLSPAIPLAKFDPKVTFASEVCVINSNALLSNIISGTKKCLENNVTVGLGTDTVCPFITHYDMWRELEYYHKLVGVTRNFALHTATLLNATILGLENETGSIQEGKSADFIVVENNPLDGFETIRKPYLVHFKDNEYFQPQIKKSELAEKLLDEYLYSI